MADDHGKDRKSTRLNSSHTEIYTLSLHDALPISGYSFAGSQLLQFVVRLAVVVGHSLSELLGGFSGGVLGRQLPELDLGHAIPRHINNEVPVHRAWPTTTAKIGRAHV